VIVASIALVVVYRSPLRRFRAETA